MALNIKDPETDRLARELAALTGQPITSAVREAVESRLAEVKAAQAPRRRLDELLEIAARGRARPILDDRSEDEILGWDANGLPS